MAIRTFNSVGGFSVGEVPTTIIDTSGNVTAKFASFAGNISVSNANASWGVLTDKLYYANGVAWDLQEAAGSNGYIQFNTSDNFDASGNLTFTIGGPYTGPGSVLDTLAVGGNITAINMSASESISANTIGANTITVDTLDAGNINVENLSANTVTANLVNVVDITATGNVGIAGNLSVTGDANLQGNTTGNFYGNFVGNITGNATVSGGNVYEVMYSKYARFPNNAVDTGNTVIAGAPGIKWNDVTGEIILEGNLVLNGNIQGSGSNADYEIIKGVHQIIFDHSNPDIWISDQNGTGLELSTNGYSWYFNQDSSLSVPGNVEVNQGSVNVPTGEVNANTLSIANAASIGGDTSITGNLAVNGSDSNFAGNLTVGTTNNLLTVNGGLQTVDAGNINGTYIEGGNIAYIGGGMQVYSDNYAQLNYNNDAWVWVDNSGVHLETTGGTAQLDNDGVFSVPQDFQVNNGNANVSGDFNVGGNVNIGTLTDGRVVLAGVNGQLVDSSAFTYSGSNLSITGKVTIGNIANVAGDLQVTSNANIDGSLKVLGNANISQNLTIAGNLTVSGTTTYVDTTNSSVKDAIIDLGGSGGGGNLTGAAVGDRGILLHGYNSGAAFNQFMGWNTANSEFQMTKAVSESGGVISGTLANLRLDMLIGSNLYGRIETANQPNIANLAGVYDISVSNTATINLATVTTLVASGLNYPTSDGAAPLAGEVTVLQTDGNSNLSFTTIRTDRISNSDATNSSVNIPVADGNVIITANGVSSLIVTDQGANVAGNLTVTDTITAQAINVTSLNPTSLTIGDSTIQAATITTDDTTSGWVIASADMSVGKRAVEFFVKGENSTGQKYTVATVTAIHDGTDAEFVVHSKVHVPIGGGGAGEFDVNYSGGNINLTVTPTSSDDTVWTTQYRMI